MRKTSPSTITAALLLAALLLLPAAQLQAAPATPDPATGLDAVAAQLRAFVQPLVALFQPRDPVDEPAGVRAFTAPGSDGSKGGPPAEDGDDPVLEPQNGPRIDPDG